jgi:chlorobactene glucosyltransferase
LGWAVLAQGLLGLLVVGSFWCILAKRVYGLPSFYGLLWPLGLLCYDLIALRAAWFVWSGRGISWKGRVYAG